MQVFSQWFPLSTWFTTQRLKLFTDFYLVTILLLTNKNISVALGFGLMLLEYIELKALGHSYNG